VGKEDKKVERDEGGGKGRERVREVDKEGK